jgi:hypothetical protein
MRDVQRREQVLASAVAAGLFSAARAEHYRGLWDADPETTERLLDVMVGVPATLLVEPPAPTAHEVAAAEAEMVTGWTRQLFPETRQPVLMEGEVVGYGLASPPSERRAEIAPPQARTTSPAEINSSAPPASPAAATFTPGDVKVWSRALFPDAPGNVLAEGAPPPLIVDCND